MAQNEHNSPEDGSRDRSEQVSNNPRQVNSELAKAFEELSKGERTATALENRLDDIESRIEQLLASVEEQARGGTGSAAQKDTKPTDPPTLA